MDERSSSEGSADSQKPHRFGGGAHEADVVVVAVSDGNDGPRLTRDKIPRVNPVWALPTRLPRDTIGSLDTWPPSSKRNEPWIKNAREALRRPESC